MTLTFSSPRNLTESFCQKDESIPLIEEPIGTALLRAADRYGQQIALVDGALDVDNHRSWTFEALASDAKRVAHALSERFAPGDHIALWAANCPAWVLIELGAAFAGIVLVPVNPAFLGRELDHVLRKSAARGIIVQDVYRGRNLVDVVEEIAGTLPELDAIVPLSTWKDFLGAATGEGSLPTVRANDMAQIQFTSGTTGVPKGACLTHRGLANNGRIYAQAIGARSGDVWINPMPMFHTAGCGLVTLGALQTGGAHVIPPGFKADDMLELFERERGTIMLCVPTMLIRILDEQNQRPHASATWRLVSLGGAPVPSDLVRRAQDRLGVEVAIGYGQTEASPYLTHTLVGDSHPNWMETVGLPLPQTEVKIVDPANGMIVPLGHPGEICGRGYGVMVGYFRDEAATASALDADGWLHTGDIGSMDALGYCRVHSRLSDMIIRGGENIYPREVEDVLFAHSAIANVAVFGLPDSEWGEVVAACIQLHKDRNATAPELDAFCRDRLASYKKPSFYYFADTFPETTSGKIQKFTLRDRVLREKSST